MNRVTAHPTPLRGAQHDLVFGFLPIISTQKLVARFGPLVDHLAKVLDQRIRLETAPDYITFLQRTNNKRYDILFTAPHFYYLAERSAGYKVIARVAANRLKSVIVARKDHNLKSLQDLKGRRLATPDDLALGTVLVRETLVRYGLLPGKDVFLIETPSHNASLMSVFNGTTDAAALMIPTYNSSPQNIKDTMIEIATTRSVPNMPISVGDTLPVSKAKKLQHALIGLIKTEEGKKVLKHLSWPMGFVKARPEDYRNLGWAIRQLDIPVN